MRVEVKIEDPAGFEEVEVVEIAVAVGDTVAEGDVLLEIATDKANMDIVAPSGGTVEEILVAQDDIIPVDQILVVLSS
jgi:pyruvate/2-oxoglutarate dehydrogenase complex dihydrolipoamide acyltransferase (E2) component